MAKLNIGCATPCGSRFDGTGINFAIYAKYATKIELCIFDNEGQETRLILPGKTKHIWHGYLANSAPPLIYGYRVYGRNQPLDGLMFYPQKLLLDPYAKRVINLITDHPSFYINDLDSARYAPKGEVLNDTFDWHDDIYPNTDWGNTILYELHVKGFTKLNQSIPENIRGTYAALSHPVIIDYFTKLGITAIELLPIQKHIDEPRLSQLKLTNYWGYNVLAPFAIEDKYWSRQVNSSPETEFKTTVKNLHQAGIEVILDVVFNHSAELDDHGPILSLKGIDKASYYWLKEDKLENWTGCGNTLKFTEQEIIQWVLDCLCYWREQYHIDGFRFDLGTILARTPEFNPHAQLLEAISAHPALTNCKLIMEPWDIGQNGYQLGQFSSPFAQWNDQYRDGIRQFWLHKNQTIGQFAQWFAGSTHLFNQPSHRPNHSINFITCHDGFTLHDLVSFTRKNNQANQEHNQDGGEHNYSYNFGYEGIIYLEPMVTDNFSHTNQQLKTILNTRTIVRTSILTTLLLSLGTPMLLAGDEFGHSQQGNNNSYCQDNIISWLDWQDFDQSLFDCAKNLIQLRKIIPCLNNNQWLSSCDVQWLNYQAQPLQADEWQSKWIKAMQIILSDCLLLLINGSQSRVEFALPNRPLIPIALTEPLQWKHFRQQKMGQSITHWQCEPNQISLFYLMED